MASSIFSALCPADGEWTGAVTALLDKLGADETFSCATVAVKVDLTAADVPPALVKALCAALRARGADVFITDCAPFSGSALAAFDAVRQLGYTPDAVGADFILADGVKGTDYDLIPMRGGKFLRSTKVGRALSDADCIVTLSRASLDSEGYRGVLHAVGFGCGARPGKVDMLTTGQPVVDQDKCKSCKMCMKIGCPAISMKGGKAKIDNTLCVGCGVCSQMCKFGAL